MIILFVLLTMLIIYCMVKQTTPQQVWLRAELLIKIILVKIGL